MSWWNAKYKNDQGEYEITFASKDYKKTKVVEKVCQAIIDKRINTDNAADFVERIIKYPASLRQKGEWIKHHHSYFGQHQCVCSECQDSEYWKKYYCYGSENFCPNCGADMRGNPHDS